MEKEYSLKDQMVQYLSKEYRGMAQEITDLDMLKKNLDERLKSLLTKQNFLRNISDSRKEEVRLAGGQGGLTAGKALTEEEVADKVMLGE